MTEDTTEHRPTEDEHGDVETELADDGLPTVESADDGELTGQSLEEAVQTIAPKRVYNWAAGGLVFGLLNFIAILMVSDDLDNLSRYGIEKSDSRFLYYIAFIFTYGLGPLLYFWQRRKKLLDSPAFDRVDYEKVRNNLDMGQPLLVWAAIGLFFVGTLLPSDGQVGTIAGFCILASMVATPVVVFFDTRKLKSNGVVWGGGRWVHVMLGFIPLFTLVYLFQRSEHLFYTALVKSTNA